MKTSFTVGASALALVAILFVGCKGSQAAPEDDSFHTSGSHEADQRAEQRVSRDEQIHGEGEGGHAKNSPKPSLYDRLGGETGIQRIVSDFVDRAIADPRTNWARKGVKHGAVLGMGGKTSEWKATPEHVETLKAHLVQFVAVASGGPTEYEGRGMEAVHNGMSITNAEFDASIGALKASLDSLKIANDEQKELLALFESTRPQIAKKR